MLNHSHYCTPIAKATHSKMGPKKMLPVNTICLQQLSSVRECSVWEGCRLITLQIVLFAKSSFITFAALWLICCFQMSHLAWIFTNFTKKWGNGGSSELHEPIMSSCLFQITASAWYFSHFFTFHVFSCMLSSPEAHTATCSPLIVPNSSDITSFYGCFFNLILCIWHQINASSHFSYLVALPAYNCCICNWSWCYGAE